MPGTIGPQTPSSDVGGVADKRADTWRFPFVLCLPLSSRWGAAHLCVCVLLLAKCSRRQC